ncbi:MAG: hypothetical protein QM487_07825 [Candidatus Marithrix sp.]
MLKQLYFIFTIAILGSFTSTIKAETDCNTVLGMPIEQCETLLQIYQTTNGDSWVNNTNWNGEDPNNFALITTNTTGNVLELKLNDNGLTGYLPNLSSLTETTQLILHSNKIAGNVPNLSNLINLTHVNLRNNQFSGSIPDFSGLAKLEKLSLYHNQLCGQIPDLTGLDSLQELDLSHNQLSGPVPNFSTLTNLRLLGISGNKKLCRIEGADYGRIEYAVSSLPICSVNDEYLTCSGSNINLASSVSIVGNGSIDMQEIDAKTVILTATPATGFIFDGWNEICTIVENDCQIAITDIDKVVANFSPFINLDEYGNDTTINVDELTISIIGEGNVDINGCPDGCTKSDNAILTANAADGFNFAGWNQVCTILEDNICQVKVVDIPQVVASFSEIIPTEVVPNVDELTVAVIGEGNVDISGCDDGCTDNVILTANAADGFYFTGWNQVCTILDDNSCQVKVVDIPQVVASFSEIIPDDNLYMLQINTVGNGKVTAIGINCGTDCQEQYVENTLVTLNAIPDDNAIFTGWSGNCSGITNTCQLTILESSNVNANFAIDNVAVFPLSINLEGNGSGVVVIDGLECNLPCVREYANNTEVLLTTRPDNNSSFVNWTGPCSGSTTFCQVIMNQPQSLVIAFNQLPPVLVADLEFVGLKNFYRVGEIVKLDLVEHIANEPIYPRLDLWIGIEDPDGLRYYMTALPLEPFTFSPQPFRNDIISYELLDKEMIYPILYFEVPAGIGGEYLFFATLTEANTELDDLLFTQNSSTAIVNTTLGNTLNPSVLPTSPGILTMFIGEDLELMIDSTTTFDAVLNSCTILDAEIVQTYATISNNNNTVSCYLRALNSGDTVLTTTDRYGKSSKTLVTVKEIRL